LPRRRALADFFAATFRAPRVFVDFAGALLVFAGAFFAGAPRFCRRSFRRRGFCLRRGGFAGWPPRLRSALLCRRGAGWGRRTKPDDPALSFRPNEAQRQLAITSLTCMIGSIFV
jgi:hypothetical protein